jgi:hypothetical protein
MRCWAFGTSSAGRAVDTVGVNRVSTTAADTARRARARPARSGGVIVGSFPEIDGASSISGLCHIKMGMYRWDTELWISG